MKTMKSVGIVLLTAVVLAAAGGCKSKESSGQGRATAQQNEAAKSLGIPKELTIDLGNNVTMKMVLIPSGKFTMGSPDNEKDRKKNEGPQREVTITKPFYMGVYEVTQEQWFAVMGTEPWKGNQFAESGPKNAASHINWNDATTFCAKLSQMIGKTVGLPTEAQWEYAWSKPVT